MRLNAFLARAGVASRRAADELIRAGRVRVNGKPGELSTFVGRPATASRSTAGRSPAQALRHVLLHKPAGVVTTARDPQGRRTVVGLVPRDTRVVPVGRLDADTTGALLLTNDGQLAHRLAHPRYRVDKVYQVEVEGDPSPRGAAPPRRRGRPRRRPRRRRRAVRRRGRGRIELTIHEGRTHQVKRMCEAVGHPVRRLHRSGYAGLDLDGLAPGEWRELTPGRGRRRCAGSSACDARGRRPGSLELPDLDRGSVGADLGPHAAHLRGVEPHRQDGVRRPSPRPPRPCARSPARGSRRAPSSCPSARRRPST